jgi:hypothetical protein
MPKREGRPGYGRYRRIRAEMIAEHVRTFGPVCPGWQREPHAVNPSKLTLDHLQPVALGGAVDDRANVRVLCVTCNQRRGKSALRPASKGWPRDRAADVRAYVPAQTFASPRSAPSWPPGSNFSPEREP